ncbi:MAG: hypothetical protein ACREMK_01970 [Gemmatimonadota bacterium]
MSPSRPPEPGPIGAQPACPHCGSTDVDLEAPFGSSLMTRQFYCKGCRTVFEWVRWEEDDPAGWLEE